MQTSLIRKLLHPIKELISRRAEKPSAEISESREESDMPEQSIECEEEVYTESEIASDSEAYTPPNDEDGTTEDDNTHTEAKAVAEPKSNRAHLTSSVPRTARVPVGALTKGEIAEIRNILGDLDDTEIQRLYKRVTK